MSVVSVNDEKKMKTQKLTRAIQETAKKDLMPTLQDKMVDTTNYIVNLLNEKGEEKVSNIQIMSIIAKKSLNEIAMSSANQTYSSQEIAIAFNLYLEMINKINEIKKFPPTVESFCNFMSISHKTFNNWMVDPEKREIMEYIQSYILGVYSVGGLTGDLREISSMYQMKCMGKVEQTQPVVIKHETTTNIDEINNQLAALKRDNIIADAEYEVIDE